MAAQLLSNTSSIKKLSNHNAYPGESITETVINGFFTVDQQWTVKYWNKAAEEILKVKAEDIVGKNLWEQFAWILPIDFYVVYHKAFLHDIPVHFEEYWGEMGSWFDVITYYSADTLSVSFKSSNQSVHPEFTKHREKRLQVISQLYRLVTEVTNDCLWEWDLQAHEMFWIDGGHKRIFGYPIENALIPQSFWENRLHPDDKIRVLTNLNNIITDGSVCIWEEEYRFRKANGEYAYVHDRGHIIYEGNEALRMIGATQDITPRVLLENKLVSERITKQREITEAVLTAQENERADIGKELHDNLNQILAIAKLYTQMAQGNEKKREIYLGKTNELIGNVIVQIRQISKRLVIPGTNIISLFDNIGNLIEDLMMVQPLKIEFHNEGIDENQLNDKLQVTLFRIVQEQLNNILKHAKASNVTISLSRPENDIILFISDDGQGCDISKEKKGVGLINIKSRAELYDGSVTVVSKPGEGYQLEVVLPFIAKVTAGNM